MTTKTATGLPALPDGILKSDINARIGDRLGRLTTAERKKLHTLPWEDRAFELWFVRSFGWCIPTLLISHPGRRAAHGTPARTYAVRVSDGQTVRIGCGPHVTNITRIVVRPDRIDVLKKYIDLRRSGAADAGTVRDRISSRRAQGVIERANGRSSWHWNA